MNRLNLVSIQADDATGNAVVTPDPVIVRKGDTVRWFSDDGPHEGEVVEPQGNPFDSPAKWKGKQHQASQPLLTAANRGVFKYAIKVTKNGKSFAADPEVIVTTQ